MTIDRGALAALLATMTVLGTALANPVAAQTEPAAPVRGLERLQTPGTQSTPDSTAIPVPAAPTIILPNTTPAPRRAARPNAAATPATDRARPRRTTERAGGEPPTTDRASTRKSPQSTTQPSTSAPEPARASSTPEPAPVATPTPEPVPQSPPAPVPVATATPTSSSTTPQQSTLSAPETGRAMPLWLSLTAIVVVLGALWALRRQPRNRNADRIESKAWVEPIPEPVAPEPVAAKPVTPPVTAAPPAPAVLSPVVPVAVIPAAAPKFLEPRGKTPPTPISTPVTQRARLTCELRPLRAGLNLLSATVECELVVTNTGEAPAEAIRAGVALITAHADQDMDLAQFNTAPVVRPVTPPFALAPGEARTLRTVAAIPREAIRTMTAANRPMFVPVLATNILYATAGNDAQLARAWVVGIERTDSAKLAPFWLDAPARMFTAVAARPHAATFER